MLISPTRALRLAFAAEECLPPGTVAEADIAAAEERYILPVVGPKLYERLLAGAYPALAEARTLLRRASRHLTAHRDEYPEYDPHRDIFNRCTFDGSLIQSL